MNSLDNRIPPPFVMLIVAAAMWGASFLTPPLSINGALRYGLIAVFFLIAALFGAPAIRAFRRSRTTIDPVHIERASALVTSGIYGITRNPMYVAITSLLLSWAAWLAAPWSLIGPVFFVLFITRFQILPEERAMGQKFGAAYADYRSRVRRWV
jgi:protein-S-isoprenylcysteine O-methyltransferase Ste14